jgi:ATP-binding cassette, subfamily A (ABC1), member 3
VLEHLKLVCELKCVPRSEVALEIAQTLRLVMLDIHKDKEVKMLSGGMKRKLSLGMSLVGKSQVIILDEPTSGLDVDSRREVWELIREIKQTRSIILSTQHIEEADVLADKVCIMSHGKVIANDTPIGIKRRYGVGYNLILEAQQQHGEFTREHRAMYDGYIVQDSQIPNCIFSQEGSNETKLTYMVPFEHEKKMAELLRRLETFPDITIALEMTSLEDAYLKIVKAEQGGFGKSDEQI